VNWDLSLIIKPNPQFYNIDIRFERMINYNFDVKPAFINYGQNESENFDSSLVGLGDPFKMVG
jgi:hypothetical protein